MIMNMNYDGLSLTGLGTDDNTGLQQITRGKVFYLG